MARKITSKRDADEILEVCHNDLDKLFSLFLRNKVKFPIVEYAAENLYPSLTYGDIEMFARKYETTGEISLYPFLGKLYQLYYRDGNGNSWDSAKVSIRNANQWYACDTISERVFGEGLLLDFDQSIIRLGEHKNDQNHWINRSPGIAVHFAVKRKIGWDKSEKLLNMLSSQFKIKTTEIAKGYGWGIETIAKYHPEKIKAYETLILDKTNASWLRYKYDLGLKKAEKIAQKRG